MTTDRIAIWLHDKKLWINDADRRTTCADVATTLTGRGSDYAVAIDGAHTATVVADPGVRVLKIWQSLRPDQKLCLRKVTGNGHGHQHHQHHYHRGTGNIDSGAGDDEDAASEMSGYRGAHRKRRREVVVKYASRTVHPKRLSNTQAAEELLKLILEQSDTIRAQLKKLQDRDKKIEKIETETHRTRADALGSNYLLDAYLGGGGCGDDKEEKDSGITEGASVENDDHDDDDEDGGIGSAGGGEVVGDIVDSGNPASSSSSSTLEAIVYLERIVKINKKLYEFEERLIRLYVNVERCRDQEQLLDELKRVETELADTEQMYSENTLLIHDTEAELRARLGYIEQLQYEAAIVDSENEYLMGSIEHQGRQQNQLENHQSNAAACRVLDTLV